MKPHRTYAIAVIIGAVLFAAASTLPLFAATADDLRKAIDEKTGQLSAIHAQIQETQKNLFDVTQKNKTLKQEIKNFDYRINQLALGMKAGEIKIEKLGLEIEALEIGIGDKQRAIGIKREAIADFLRELNEKTRENLLALFLANRTLAESVSQTQSIADVNEKLSGEVAALETVREQLTSNLTAVTAKKREVETEYGGLKVKKMISEEQKDARQDLLKTTKNQEKTYQEQLKELEKKQKEIGDAIDEIEAQLRKSFDPNLLPAKRPGVFIKPIAGAPLTQGYGATSFAQKAYKTGFHNGADYGAPIGTPVVAARDGKVIGVGNNGKYQYGKYIAIEHDIKLTTLYAHLSKQLVAPGETVTAGQLIGYSGNTGYSFGPHVHLTVYWSDSVIFKSFSTCPNCGLIPVGVTINPLDYI